MTGAPRAVFADMDDTFMTYDKSLPQANLHMLDVLARLGIPFVPCTGRPVSAVPECVLMHEATRFAVGSNGAVIHDARSQRVLHLEAMEKSAVLALYGLVKDLEVTFDVFADGEVLAERCRYEAMGGYGIDEPSLAVLRRVRKPVDLTVPQIVARVRAIEKITCFWHTPQDQQALREAIAAVPGFSVASGHVKNFELQAVGVSKGYALGWICDHAGLSTKDVVAFGDAENDIPMLVAAGDGVAMANARPAVMAVASHVAGDNNQGGLAQYLSEAYGLR